MNITYAYNPFTGEDLTPRKTGPNWGLILFCLGIVGSLIWVCRIIWIANANGQAKVSTGAMNNKADSQPPIQPIEPTIDDEESIASDGLLPPIQRRSL